MKPHIKLSNGYWVWIASGCDAEMKGDIWDAASNFIRARNRKEGRWPWRMMA